MHRADRRTLYYKHMLHCCPRVSQLAYTRKNQKILKEAKARLKLAVTVLIDRRYASYHKLS